VVADEITSWYVNHLSYLLTLAVKLSDNRKRSWKLAALETVNPHITKSFLTAFITLHLISNEG